MFFLSRLITQWKAHHASYGPEVNSHDLIKALAVLIMICDHVGLYFAPDDHWYRAIGRIGFPVWFFMAGYSRTGGWAWSLLPGLLLLVFTRYALGYSVLPINALLTIFIIRAMIMTIPKEFGKTEGLLALPVCALALTLYQPTTALFEYGTIGLLFGYLGYVVRNNQDGWPPRLLAIGAYTAFMLCQLYPARYDLPQGIFMAIGTAFFVFWLYRFRTVRYAQSRSWLGLAPVIRALGRHTLLIYVLHLYIFAVLLRANYLQLLP